MPGKPRRRRLQVRKREFNYRALIGEDNPLLRYRELREAAIDEFSQRRYGDASLNDILKKAGMSKGSFYHHFGDKFGLYVAMMDLITRKKLSFFYPLLEQGLDTSDFFGTLKLAMRATTEFMLADERMHHLSNRLMEEDDHFRGQLFRCFGVDYYQSFNDWVYQAVQSGEIDSRYPPEFVVKVVEIMFANVHKLLSAGDPEHLLETACQVIDVIQHGISSKKGDA
jgi:AcrR family transcriptional regulator